MSYLLGLRCAACGHRQPPAPVHTCPACLGPLELEYDMAAMRAELRREDVAAGPATMWRYRALLPVGDGPVVDLGTGFTPLLRADNLARALGLRHVYIKNDAVNPTGSFKDRVVGVAATVARGFGLDTLACASTGNLAASVAAHAARAGMRSFVFVPADLEPAKLIGTAAYGTRLVAVRGNYDAVNRLCAELVDVYGWAFVNINLRPFYSEGSKTLAFETAEQLGWRAPDHVVAPIAGGSVLSRIAAGFAQLQTLGWIPPTPVRVSGAQASGCAPVAGAFKAGWERPRPVRPQTICKSLAIGDPADGALALAAIRASGGACEDASDEEIVAGMRLLAECEGILAETAGGVTVAVARKLAAAGVLRPEETVVLYITGNGLKTLDALGEGCQPLATIAPRLEDVEEMLAGVAA
jgi:threonine synthase